MAVTDATREAVWQGGIDAERLARYYDALSAKYQARYVLTRFLLLFTITGGILLFVAGVPDELREIDGMVNIILWAKWLLPIAALALGIWDHVAGYAKKSTMLFAIGKDCGECAIRWRTLWYDVDREDADDAAIRKRLQEIEGELFLKTAGSGYDEIKEDRRKNVAATLEAYEDMRARYYTAGQKIPNA